MSEIMINGMVRRLTDKDLPSINDLLIEQRISPLHISRLPEEWLLYGAFEEDKLIALCGLFCSSLTGTIPADTLPSWALSIHLLRTETGGS